MYKRQDKGEDEISEVIISLGKLMKYCVDKNNGIVTLGQEIEYVMSYLHIQKKEKCGRRSCHNDNFSKLS